MLSTTRARERSKRSKKCKCRNRGGKMKRGGGIFEVELCVDKFY